MGIDERKDRNKQRLRDEIIQAARDILSAEGYTALSVRKIAARIEYSTGVIYHYFEDKDAIVRAVAEAGYRRILGRMEETPFDPARPLEGFRAFFVRYFELMLEDRRFSRMALLGDIPGMVERTVVLPQGVAHYSPTFRLMTGRLAAAMDQGLVRRGDPELMAQIFWLAAYGLLCRLLLEPDPGSGQRERLQTELFVLMERYLRPCPDQVKG